MAYTTIDDPEAYFQPQLYTGNGSANHAITLDGDTDMQPDLVWIKNRDATDSHVLFDSVRGATKLLDVYTTAAEATDADTLDSFASDGFQVDADVKVNTNAEKYVAWCWKESATAGFDIVAYTGTGSAKTESHSLSAVPKMIVVKNRSDVDAWRAYHHMVSSDAEDRYLIFHQSAASADDNTVWNDTAPTTSVFSVGTSDETNENTDSLIAYLWSEKQGYSKFGEYTGTGNVDGPFAYTGFRPAYVLTKARAYGQGWLHMDNKRPGYNPVDAIGQSTAAEYTTGFDMDFLSNGFKVRTTDGATNASGQGYIFMAFAEQPFVNTNKAPANAR